VGLPLRLPPSVVRRLRELSLAAWPDEACGLLAAPTIRPRRVSRAHHLANLAEDRATGYLIDPETFLRLERSETERGRDIVGVWHSHPHGDPAPSERDHAEAWPDWSYLILGVTNAGLSAAGVWRLDAGRLQRRPLIVESGSLSARTSARANDERTQRTPG